MRKSGIKIKIFDKNVKKKLQQTSIESDENGILHVVAESLVESVRICRREDADLASRRQGREQVTEKQCNKLMKSKISLQKNIVNVKIRLENSGSLNEEF